MKETAKEKSAKKPRPERATLASLNHKVDLMDSRLRTLKAWETMQDAMEESRSAPAEEWVPKERELVVPIAKSANGNDHTGCVMPVQEDDESPHDYRFRVHPDDADDENRWYRLGDLRPATEAEVSDHKAKEEQRAKEAGWAKYDVLQEGDACILSVDLIKELTTLGLRTASETTFTRYDGVQWMFGKLGGYKHGFGPNDSLLEAEFLRRAKGTAAKRLEDERAKEMAKPLEFGMRVREIGGDKEEGLWIRTDGTGRHILAFPGDYELNSYHRSAFTIID